MEEEFGAVVVMDLVGSVFFPFMDTASLDTMVEGLASKIMNYNMIRHGRFLVEPGFPNRRRHRRAGLQGDFDE
jgi:hypothetical protein